MNQQLQLWILLVFLGIFTVQDLRTKKISLLLLLMAAAVGAVLYFWLQPFSVSSLMVGVGIGAALLLVSLCSRGRIGAGDGLLLMVIGVYLGAAGALWILMTAMLISGAAALVLVIGKKAQRTDAFPFVPCLLTASILRLFLLLWGM